MMFRGSQRLSLVLGCLLAMVGVTSSGCLGERPAINQVQPDFLDKEQLIPVQYNALVAGSRPETLTEDMIRREPVWAHQVTIIDKPATTGAQGISWYTQLEKINWEVSEGFLIARQSYDRLRAGQSAGPVSEIAGDNRFGIAGNPRQGEILAVYRISSHFDIRRAYNQTTGEEQNIVVENSSDRPWYQRRYMRVDWSQNLVGGYSAMSYAEWEGKVRAEPVPNYLSLPNDPNRPVFEYATVNGRANTLKYFDVTARMIMHPEEVNLGQWGYPNIPACALDDTGITSCQPADVLLRQSFMRIDPNRDYEPQSLDGHRMDRFGFFESGTLGFDRNRGDILSTNRRHFSNRHNLWMQHHARPEDQTNRAPAGTLHHLGANGSGDVQCRTDADCAVVSNSATCDRANNRCGERYIRCTQDSDCASVGFNASCDIAVSYLRADRSGLCLLPYRARRVRPLPYHLSINFPDRMMPVTEDIVAQWNSAFSRAVTSARRRECLLDPGVANKSECDRYTDAPEADDGKFVFVGCHNPVWGTDMTKPGYHPQAEVDAARNRGWDRESCGPQGTSARLGDLRYNMIGSINDYDRHGAWGLANISGDPESGEVYSARGAVWQTITDNYAAYATDLMRLLNGELAPETIANGENVVEAYGMGVRMPNGRVQFTGSANGQLPTSPRRVSRDVESPEELDAIISATRMDHLLVSHSDVQTTGLNPNQLPDMSRLSFDDLARGPSGRRTSNNFISNAFRLAGRTLPIGASPGSGSGNDLARLRGTDVERAMVNDQLLASAGFDPRLGLTEEAMEKVSPARGGAFALRMLRDRIRGSAAANQCNYEADFDDGVIAVMLERFKNNAIPEEDSFGRTWGPFVDSNGNLIVAEVQRYLTQYIHRGVMMHELGHSIGQRHNFSASADAINYHDNYWALRSARHNNDSRQVRPRFDYLAANQPYYADAERRGGVDEYAYSSVMDYKGWNEDAHGLGHYDFAFVKHGYVNMVEAFDTIANSAEALHMFEGTNGGGQQAVGFGLAGSSTALRLTSFHYTDIPRIVGTVQRTAPNGMSGQYPNLGNDNRYDVFLHETAPQGYNAFGWSPEQTNVTPNNRDGTPADRPHVLVPYRFATDDRAGYYWYNQRFDAGADMFESMRYTQSRYLDYYFSNSFARERVSFNIDSYMSRMAGRYLNNLYYVMRLAAIYTVFYKNIFNSVTNYDQWQNFNDGRAVSLGIATVFDTFVNALLMPERGIFGGGHTLRTYPDGQQVYADANFGESTAFELAHGDGRAFESRWDFDSGYFWRERPINAGSFYDKLLATQYVTQTFLYAPEADLGQDLRDYQVNMHTVYPGQTIRLYGSILSQDHEDIGPQVRVSNRTPTVLRTQMALLNRPMGTNIANGQNGRDPALRSIDPNLGFTMELWSAIYSIYSYAHGYDQRFIQYARLWADGDPNVVTLTGAGQQTVSFTDPFTRLTYRAVHYGYDGGDRTLDPGASRRESARPGSTADSAERGIGARMILHANDLAQAWTNARSDADRRRLQRTLQQYVDLLNVMRGLNRSFAENW